MAAPGTVAPDLVVRDEEQPARRLTGRLGLAVSIAAALIVVFAVYQALRPLAQGGQFYLILFLAAVLPLVFLCYRARPGADATRPSVVDWVLAAVALIVAAYPVLVGYNAFLDRQGLLDPADVVAGGILLVLLLEACRRTTGWVLPVVCLLALAYCYYGGYLPQSWSIAHAGLDVDQIIDALYNSGSGFYGTPLDVAATYIVLFTLYGAVLSHSGAGQFFVDLSVAAFRRSRGAAGRTAVAAGFLLGTVSGSGTATAVSVGAVTWPILRRAGYPATNAGGMLAAAGVGAILSPPTLGAAAFIIAEYLDVSYLQVLGWATVPTILYYLGILLAVEIDARRFGVRPVEVEARSPWRLLARFGYHFSSLLVVLLLLFLGRPVTEAVLIATAVAFALSFLDRSARLTPRRLFAALAEGGLGVLTVTVVCASAGIITATMTKTGLAAQTASLLVDGARAIVDDPVATLALTAVLAAVALLLLGLAVPVTASFIIGWVVIGPALLELGVPAAAAAMFVFYYSVLSEVTPPTALAAVGATAVTGGAAIPTMWQALKYALPAFLVPLSFVLTDAGEGLLGRGGWATVLVAAVVAALGVAALAVATGGWVLGVGAVGRVGRVLAGLAALLLLYLEPVPVVVGLVLLAAAAAVAVVTRKPEEGVA
ncbi:TRAP transporter permease [Cryptosporangium aurantiacum]|uniref:TRAP transporter, 4TM/12TM fusion protein n=1 Tax=Cryptosporangium aurantiacum TaxID=134849 RepID=A0A1M7JPF3_9ACTN|nr:TRAP transporter fused permease subunit [Cryptosporangium aurantiacum]SHM54979.1 TRAP transporter, 4TM/12TM fusion protein [Cryptosporangium aurantiacum]